MATSGEKFLRLTKATGLHVTGHALERIRERTGIPLESDEAFEHFRDARQIRLPQLLTLGYRPRYEGRRQRGCQSWYFRMNLDGQEIIAVVQQGPEPEQYLWVTSYAPDAQALQYRVSGMAAPIYAA
jgi:hypothetical protein